VELEIMKMQERKSHHDSLQQENKKNPFPCLFFFSPAVEIIFFFSCDIVYLGFITCFKFFLKKKMGRGK